MEGCEAPCRVVDPGPAPRLHMRPVAVTIRCPVAHDHARRPQPAVFAVVDPVAVRVQIFVPGHVWRDAALNHVTAVNLVPVLVARVGPAIERRFRRGLKLKRDRFAARAHQQRFAGLHAVASIAPVEVRTSIENGDARLDAVRKCLDAIAAAHGKNKLACAGLDAKGFAVIAPVRVVLGANAQVDGAALQERLRQIVVNAYKIENRAIVDAQRGRADAHFRATAVFGPQRILAGDREIDCSALPAVIAIHEKRNLALDVAQATHPRGRLGKRRHRH